MWLGGGCTFHVIQQLWDDMRGHQVCPWFLRDILILSHSLTWVTKFGVPGFYTDMRIKMWALW